MRSFTSHGFQLSRAQLGTKLTYTFFLVFVVLGAVSMGALSIGRIGLSPDAIATYYRGGESELSFPRPFWQMVEVSHFHLFSVPVVLLVLTHLVFATKVPPRLAGWATIATWVGALLQLGAPWGVRYASAGFAWVLLLAWALLMVGMVSMSVASLASMWKAQQPNGEKETAE